MFRGHFEHGIDDKGRTSLPARFRHALGDADLRLILTPALADPCLDVYPLPAWEELEAKVAKLPRWDRDAVRLRRRYVTAAVECEIDRQGRLLIPAALRAHAALDKVVLWAGVGSTMELWGIERWRAEEALPDEELQRWRSRIGEKLAL
jgi:MraZ protein